MTASLHKQLGAFRLEAEFRLDVGITALLGPSGSGKTTLLRCLAGLERPEAGLISRDGEVWFEASRGIALPPQRRRVGMVFNDYALFPHLNVRRNVAYGAKDPRRVSALLDRMELAGLEERIPAQLSAGQQQRVALARAIASEPSLLLMDEPFAALDPLLRDRLHDALLPQLASLGIPVLLVSHDLAEACHLATSLLIMDEGRILRQGSPSTLLDSPGSPRTAQLLDMRNVFEALPMPGGRLRWGPWELSARPGEEYRRWGIRAERVEVSPSEGDNVVPACVRELRLTAHGTLLRAEVSGAGVVEARIPPLAAKNLEVGGPVRLRLPAEAIRPLGE